MTATRVGYARCSTDQQDLAAQQAMLQELGCHFQNYLGSGPILVMSGEAWYIPHLYPEETRTAIP